MTKATDTHRGYVIPFAFPWQLWLCKCTLVLHLYVHCLSGLIAYAILHWDLVASPVVSWDLFPLSHAVKVNWRSWWVVSLAVSSSYSINGKCVLMGTHIRMVLDWVAFLLNAPEDLDLHLILVCGCCGGSLLFFCWVSACKFLSSTPVSVTTPFLHFSFQFITDHFIQYYVIHAVDSVI